MSQVPHRGSSPPPRKEGWQHSDRVLAYYGPCPELGLTDTWGIAYYHYNPPFEDKPRWISFTHSNRGAPDWWWTLPAVPVHTGPPTG